jgi:heme exporter protein C
MGPVQRIFYFHIGTAWTALLGFLFASVLSVIYLITKNLKWDLYQVAAIEVSLVFFLITIMLGSIWAYPAWNTWWTWDPRLTTAAVTELIYVAYFMLRQGIDDPDRRARFGAVYALVGGLSAPITFFAIRLFRTIHPVVIGGTNPEADGGFSMTPDMRSAFFFALFAFSVIFIDLFWNRIRLGDLQEKVEQLKLKVSM